MNLPTIIWTLLLAEDFVGLLWEQYSSSEWKPNSQQQQQQQRLYTTTTYDYRLLTTFGNWLLKVKRPPPSSITTKDHLEESLIINLTCIDLLPAAMRHGSQGGFHFSWNFILLYRKITPPFFNSKSISALISQMSYIDNFGGNITTYKTDSQCV